MSRAADDQPKRSRRAIEQASGPLLNRLSRLPRAVPFAATLVVAAVGLFVGGAIGFVIVAVAMLIPAWLLYLGWPALATPERLMRLAVLFFVLGLAAVTLLPHG